MIQLRSSLNYRLVLRLFGSVFYVFYSVSSPSTFTELFIRFSTLLSCYIASYSWVVGAVSKLRLQLGQSAPQSLMFDWFPYRKSLWYCLSVFFTDFWIHSWRHWSWKQWWQGVIITLTPSLNNSIQIEQDWSKTYWSFWFCLW